MKQHGEEPPALMDEGCNDKQAAAAAAAASHDESTTTRDWAALPRDVVLEILGRLRHADILGGAGLACGAWRRAASDEPELWRHIDLSFDESRGDVVSTEGRAVRLAMGRAAVDRSAGQCHSFRCPADCHMLLYLADRAPCLRSIMTMTWCLPKEFSDKVVTKLPMLERLEVEYGGHVLEATLLGLLEHCPRLQVLDAYDCSTDAHVELDIWRKFRKLKFVRLPWFQSRCYCNRCFREDPPRCFCKRCIWCRKTGGRISQRLLSSQ